MNAPERSLNPPDHGSYGAEEIEEALDDIVTDILAGDSVGQHSLKDVFDEIDGETIAQWILDLKDAPEKDLWSVRRTILDQVEEKTRLYFQPLDDIIESRIEDAE